MEVKFKGYKHVDNILDFTLEEDNINGIIGKEYKELVEVINLKSKYKGKILIDNIELNKESINTNKRRLSIIDEFIEDNIYQNTIYDLLYYEIIRKKLNIKDIDKKIKGSLKIVGLSQEVLEKSIHTVSTSEIKLIQIAKALISNPELIILIEPFKFLDTKNEKRIVMLLNKIKEQYHKTIVIVSNNSNVLYKYTTHLIIYKNGKILIEGNTQEIFQRVDFLSKNKINIPEIVEVTYIARRKKKVDIEYHRDIRDIIKDIYKHV